MDLPITIEPALATALHAQLQRLVADLHATAASDTYRHVPALRTALTVVLRATRNLEAAVLPAPEMPLPSDSDLGWPERDADLEGCSVPLDLDLTSARSLVILFTDHSQALNTQLANIQRQLPGRKAPRNLVLRFAHVMGYLYTEICQPLHRKHPELEPIALGEKL